MLSADGTGTGVVSHAGATVVLRAAEKTGLTSRLSEALAPWRKPLATHDPGKIIADLAVAVVIGGDCLADINQLRADPAVFGQVASDPTVSRLISTLADDAPASGAEDPADVYSAALDHWLATGAADLDELAPGHHHLPAHGERVEHEEHGGRVVVDDDRRLRPRQPADQRLDMAVALAPLAADEVVLEVRGAGHHGGHCLDRLRRLRFQIRQRQTGMGCREGRDEPRHHDRRRGREGDEPHDAGAEPPQLSEFLGRRVERLARDSQDRIADASAVASESLDLSEGETVTVAGVDIAVDASTADLEYSHSPVMWVPTEFWQRAMRSDADGTVQKRDAGSDLGGTMRLGAQSSDVKPGTLAHEIYGPVVTERHRHRYEANEHYLDRLQQAGLVI